MMADHLFTDYLILRRKRRMAKMSEITYRQAIKIALEVMGVFLKELGKGSPVYSTSLRDAIRVLESDAPETKENVRLRAEITRLKMVLRGIQEMSAEDIRLGNVTAATCVYQVEADARAALQINEDKR